MKSLFKSKDCRKAKGLLESFNGRDMDISYPQIGNPPQIETAEQMTFLKLLHKTIMDTDKGPTSKPKKSTKTAKTGMTIPQIYGKKA